MTPRTPKTNETINSTRITTTIITINCFDNTTAWPVSAATSPALPVARSLEEMLLLGDDDEDDTKDPRSNPTDVVLEIMYPSTSSQSLIVLGPNVDTLWTGCRWVVSCKTVEIR